MFDLDAPIIPGKSAAGIHLGDDVAEIVATTQPMATTPLGQETRYDFGSIALWVDNLGKVKQIGLYKGYQGKLINGIGIDSTLREVSLVAGEVSEDEEDNLITPGLPGWCFETELWHQPQIISANLSARVNGIFVFPELEEKNYLPQ